MVYCNCNLNAGDSLTLRNGATRRSLVLVNKTGADIHADTGFDARVGVLHKGNHFFVFLNVGKTEEDRYILVDDGYGVSIHEKDPIDIDTSTGGPGNSESTLAVLSRGTLIERNSYKNRRGSTFLLCGSNGFEKVPLADAWAMLGCVETTV
jgi:hypothetical protein